MKTNATFLSPPVYQGRGTTYLPNQGRWIYRGRGGHTSPNTPRQAILKNRMQLAGISWKMDLTAAQRNAWTAYAAATPYTSARYASETLQGHVMYTTVMLLRLAAGITAPPVTAPTPGLATYTPPAWSLAPLTVVVRINPADTWANQNNGRMILNIELPQRSTGRMRRAAGQTLGVIHGSASTPPAQFQTFPLPHRVDAGHTVYVETRVVDGDARPNDAGKTRPPPHTYQPTSCYDDSPAPFAISAAQSAPNLVVDDGATCWHFGVTLPAPSIGLPTLDIGSWPHYASCSACLTYEPVKCSDGTPAGFVVSTAQAIAGHTFELTGVCYHFPNPLPVPTLGPPLVDISGATSYAACATCGSYQLLKCTDGTGSGLWVRGTQAVAGLVLKHGGTCYRFASPLGAAGYGHTLTDISGDTTYAACSDCLTYEPVKCSDGSAAGYVISSAQAIAGRTYEYAGTCYHIPSPLPSPTSGPPLVDVSGATVYADCGKCGSYQLLKCSDGTGSGLWVRGTQASAGLIVKHGGVCYSLPSPLPAAAYGHTITSITGDTTYATCAACAGPVACPTVCTGCPGTKTLVVAGNALACLNRTWTMTNGGTCTWNSPTFTCPSNGLRYFARLNCTGSTWTAAVVRDTGGVNSTWTSPNTAGCPPNGAYTLATGSGTGTIS